MGRLQAQTFPTCSHFTPLPPHTRVRSPRQYQRRSYSREGDAGRGACARSRCCVCSVCGGHGAHQCHMSDARVKEDRREGGALSRVLIMIHQVHAHV